MANVENDDDYWILLMLSITDRRFCELLKFVNRASLVNKLAKLVATNSILKFIPNPQRPHLTLYKITETGKQQLYTKVWKRLREIDDELSLIGQTNAFPNKD